MFGIKETLRRWRDILAYSLLAALFGFMLRGVIAGAADRLFAPAFEQSPKLLATMRGGGALILLAVIWTSSGARLSHFRFLLRYPSIFVAIPIALWGVVALTDFGDPSDWNERGVLFWCNPLSVSAVVTTALTLLACIAAFALSIRKDSALVASNGATPAGDLTALPFEKLRLWLSSETPIGRSQEDFFRADERSRRVLKALQTVREDGSGREIRQTVVVQGPFGAGKSTVVRLAEEYAKSAGECFIFAHVNCWGFSSISAQEHVLEEAVAALGHFVDCLALRHVPSDYAEALTKTNSWFGIIRLLHGAENPVSLLQRFTPILRAINAQLVIVIEDTDRNGPDFDQKHIEAMLYNFREVERVSFVLTAGSRSEIEFPKIAEHILFLPSLPQQTVLALLDRVRDHCSKNWKFIDPTADQSGSRNRRTSLREDAFTSRVASQMFNYRTVEWPAALASILNTPRRLKQTLSAILARWEILAGEVDLDELIMITTLRNCAPAVFTFFGIHLEEFKALSIAKDRELPEDVKRREKRVEYLTNSWLRAVEESEFDSEILGAILAELIPASKRITGLNMWEHGNRSQSINSSRRNVYWERLTSESLSDREIRDQEVLSAMGETTSDEGVETFAKQFSESADFAELATFFDHFSHRIDDATLLKVGSSIVQMSRPLFPSRWDCGPNPFGTFKKWAKRIPYSDPKLVIWLIEEMKACIPGLLMDANELYFEFAPSQLDLEARVTVRNQFIEWMRGRFGDGLEGQFSSYFELSNPYALRHLIRLDGNQYPEALLTRIKDWKWMAPVLLQGMSDHPQIVVPQVITVFGEYGPDRAAPTRFNFDENALSDLFGNDLAKAVLLLSQELDVGGVTDAVFRSIAPMARVEAEKWTSRIKNVL